MAPRTDGGASGTRGGNHRREKGRGSSSVRPTTSSGGRPSARVASVESRRTGPVPAEELRVGLDRGLLLVRAPVALVRAVADPPDVKPGRGEKRDAAADRRRREREEASRIVAPRHERRRGIALERGKSGSSAGARRDRPRGAEPVATSVVGRAEDVVREIRAGLGIARIRHVRLRSRLTPVGGRSQPGRNSRCLVQHPDRFGTVR